VLRLLCIDSTLTGDFDRKTLLQLLFVVSGLSPQLKLSHVRCLEYKQMYGKMQHAAESRKEKCDEHKERILKEATPDVIAKVSQRMGFKDAWLEEKGPPRNTGVQQTMMQFMVPENSFSLASTRQAVQKPSGVVTLLVQPAGNSEGVWGFHLAAKLGVWHWPPLCTVVRFRQQCFWW
jgi:hypothetical protein